MPAALREKCAGENHVNGMKGVIVRLGSVLEFFNDVGNSP